MNGKTTSDEIKDLTTYYQETILSIKTLLNGDVQVITNLDDLNIRINKSHIVMMTWDHWGDDEFLCTPIEHRPMSEIDRCKNFTQKHPEKKFYILSAVPDLHKFFANEKNIKVLCWGDNFLLLPDVYYGIKPMFEKTFQTNWHWICFSNRARFHRIISYLILLGLDINHGNLRFDPSTILRHESWSTFEYFLKINDYNYLDSIKSDFGLMSRGFDKIKSQNGYTATNFTVLHDAADNFERYLKTTFYKHSAVEIVNESVFISENGGIITEKYTNTVYGANFPIILNVPKTVDRLRSLGFDMFDDIIDHSYDNISDPYKRMMAAITYNLPLLKNRQNAISLWNKCQDRFKSNYYLIEAMYQNKEELIQQKLKEFFYCEIDK